MASDAPRASPPVLPGWLPNAISAVRVVLVPVWLWLAFEARDQALAQQHVQRWAPALVFLALGLSDVLDGYLARRFDLATNFGATLDAVADKLAQVATVTFLALRGPPAFEALPLWLWGTLLARDGLLGLGFVLVRWRHGVVHTQHRWHGKASSFLLFGLVFAVCLGLSGPVVLAASAAVLLLVVPSTAAYLREGLRQLKGPQ